jgi:hypothetical protein
VIDVPVLQETAEDRLRVDTPGPRQDDYLRLLVDHINLEAIDHLVGVITVTPAVDPCGMLREG